MTKRADEWTGTGTIVFQLDETGFHVVSMAHPPKGTAQILADYAGRVVFFELSYVVVTGNLGAGLVEIGEMHAKSTQMSLPVVP